MSWRRMIWMLAASLALSAHAGEDKSQGRKLLVFMNPANSETPSSQEVAEYFKAQRQFWGGVVPVTLVLQDAGSEAHKALLQRVIKLSADDLVETYEKKRYQGTLALKIK